MQHAEQGIILLYFSNSIRCLSRYHVIHYAILVQFSLWYIFVSCRVDSVMLLEEGFDVTSVDASDKMLKTALKTRWARRKEDKFDEWGKFYAVHFLTWQGELLL